jgi:hypothetical protein
VSSAQIDSYNINAFLEDRREVGLGHFSTTDVVNLEEKKRKNCARIYRSAAKKKWMEKRMNENKENL